MPNPRNRVCSWSIMSLCAAILAPATGWTQTSTAPGISPAAPPTLKAPIFDTVKSVYSPPRAKTAETTVVAQVDGVPITLGEVADAIRALPGSMQNLPYDVLFPIVQDRLIGKSALVIDAQHRGVDADPAVRRAMQAASDDALVEGYLRREATQNIPEQTLLDRYAKDFAGKPGPEEAHIRIIMLPTEAEALDVIRQLQSGADFDTLASRLSKDSTASTGGDMGFVAKTAINPELAGAVFATHASQLIPLPVESAGSWFVVKVEEKRRQPPLPYALARERLIRDLARERMPTISKAAMAGRTVRIFSIGGQEIEALPEEKAASQGN
jgi:peptidyl-prolyl cis-trans isomerase C